MLTGWRDFWCTVETKSKNLEFCSTRATQICTEKIYKKLTENVIKTTVLTHTGLDPLTEAPEKVIAFMVIFCNLNQILRKQKKVVLVQVA